MKKKQLDLMHGSGNIYRDFNVADADVRQLKAILAARYQVIQESIGTPDPLYLRYRM